MNRAEVYSKWGLPSIQIGSGVLIAKEYVTDALEMIYENGYYFLGYDAFTVHPDGKRQPHVGFSASFNKGSLPTLSEAKSSLALDPKEITHYEFVFEPSA
ncbi:MAG: hypothetical protein MK096_04010 [Oleiphilaceae bacterium]|uniref:hypothetical protein n=1 Tax=Oleiphilus sp. HI0125 TaxID=1822266 RepID=UPI0007C22BDF|nr:hypothetical protein [Oleiphilus sp. HI0125]KZZ63173.1 hypothetical protein A3762_12670 [Oleiphilus sp. HI0125]MCH2157925.1 hypothetical protein [Oleiphilaceae bacterium]